MYSSDPEDPREFTRNFDRFYTRFAPLYSLLLSTLPIWLNWIDNALPHLVGPRVLEVSFGTGHLMERYASRFETFGIDLNARMARQAAGRLRRAGLNANLQIADALALPYANGIFNCVISTMAFSGYPDGKQALREMRRVLADEGRLVMVDVNFPADGNRIGRLLAKFWKASGDVIRDVPEVFDDIGWSCDDQEVGGYGSVHLYLAKK